MGTAGDHRGPEPGRGRQEGWRFDALLGDPETLEQPCRRADPKGTKTAALADVVGAARRRNGTWGLLPNDLPNQRSESGLASL